MSDSGSSSEGDVAPQTAKKSPEKLSKKSAASSSKATSTAHGRNEGTDPNYDYQPPQGAVPVDLNVNPGEFNWEALKDDDGEDLELWVIRVPQGLKPKHLQDIKFDCPSSSETSRIGSIDRKHASYDIWSLGDSPSDHVGGEELKRLSCLLPRKSKDGKLYQAPIPVARHIVVTAKSTVATPAEDAGEQEAIYKNPPRPRYPLEVLTHRFMPLGALASTGAPAPDAMDVDQPVPAILSQDTDVPPKKKRKGDGTSKKQKKSKAVA